MTGARIAKGIKRNYRPWLPALLLLLILASAGFPLPAAGAEKKPVDPEKPWSVELRVKRTFASHTSYEFGNPYPPMQAPLSRLEFPLNTWWAGGEFRRRFSRFSAGIEILRSISKESDGSFKDSDWSDDTRPLVKDIYSEAQCRVEPSYMGRADADLKVGDWLGLPAWFDLRPVAGVRWQQLEFVAHNDVQEYPASGGSSSPDHFPGDGIRFKQTYWQPFVGLKAAFELPRLLGTRELTLYGQGDWAYVDADNSDRHLLLPGIRMTYEQTTGYAWHALVGLKAGLTRSLKAGLEADYLRINTSGTHRWVHDLSNADKSWVNGVNVWSEQIGITMTLEYRF